MAQIEVRFDYDKEADVLYITLGTGEPSYCEEVDDILLVERGLLSNKITGFRILDVRHHGIDKVGLKVSGVIKKEKPPLWVPHLDAIEKKFGSERLRDMVHA
jgi:uncharacterized protein YuzE